jgi:hypothetical protein
MQTQDEINFSKIYLKKQGDWGKSYAQFKLGDMPRNESNQEPSSGVRCSKKLCVNIIGTKV